MGFDDFQKPVLTLSLNDQQMIASNREQSGGDADDAGQEEAVD